MVKFDDIQGEMIQITFSGYAAAVIIQDDPKTSGFQPSQILCDLL